MLFNSLTFLVFFPIVLAAYFLLPSKYRWIWLLLVSYYFYMCWNVQYIFLILGSTVIDYIVARRLEVTQAKPKRKLWLSLSLASNLGILFIFKYFNFFNHSLEGFFSYFSLPYEASSLSLLLPVGISFYTFQTLGYAIDVYRGSITAERHFGRFALYVSFFPQLVAGPIERAKNLLPQFREKVSFDYQRITDGLKLMAWGFFKKVVIADRLAIYVNEVYNQPQESSTAQLIIGTYFFAFQIYCDFSGYSDIAIGTAKVLGFDLMENFRRPYFSRSIREFWGRWHISLSTWFKDYLYIPLGGNRVKFHRHLLNLLIVFVVSGLWHGANWTFVIWGALHGVYLIAEILIAKWLPFMQAINPRLRKVLQLLITFHLAVFAWIFFRANSTADAFYIVQRILSLDGFSLNNVLFDGMPKAEFMIALASIAIMELIQSIQERTSVRGLIAKIPSLPRWGLYLVWLLVVIIFGVYRQQEFLYFQF